MRMKVVVRNCDNHLACNRKMISWIIFELKGGEHGYFLKLELIDTQWYTVKHRTEEKSFYYLVHSPWREHCERIALFASRKGILLLTVARPGHFIGPRISKGKDGSVVSPRVEVNNCSLEFEKGGRRAFPWNRVRGGFMMPWRWMSWWSLMLHGVDLRVQEPAWRNHEPLTSLVLFSSIFFRFLPPPYLRPPFLETQSHPFSPAFLFSFSSFGEFLSILQGLEDPQTGFLKARTRG